MAQQQRRECERRFRLLRAMLDDRRYVMDEPGTFFHALRATDKCDNPRLGFKPGFDAVRQKVLGDLSDATHNCDDLVGKRKSAQVLFHHHYWLAREVTKRLSVWDRLKSLAL